MNKQMYALAVSILLFTACKKEETKNPETPVNTADQTAPVITLKGKKNDTISLQTTFMDAGATAIDDKDGDISAFIIVSGSVNTNVTGDYVKEYNVRDGAGNIAVKATRQIRVKNDVDYLNGSYTVACNCQTIEPGVSTLQNNTNYTASVVASATINNSFNVSSLHNGNTTGAFILSASALNVSGFNPPGSISGTVSASKTTFTMNSLTYDVSYPSRSFQCTNIYTKQ
jgi:hypothetical protein